MGVHSITLALFVTRDLRWRYGVPLRYGLS